MRERTRKVCDCDSESGLIQSPESRIAPQTYKHEKRAFNLHTAGHPLPDWIPACVCELHPGKAPTSYGNVQGFTSLGLLPSSRCRARAADGRSVVKGARGPISTSQTRPPVGTPKRAMACLALPCKTSIQSAVINSRGVLGLARDLQGLCSLLLMGPAKFAQIALHLKVVLIPSSLSGLTKRNPCGASLLQCRSAASYEAEPRERLHKSPAHRRV